MTKEELIKNQFPNDEFLQSGVSQIVDKCIAELEKENAELKAQLESERDLPAIAYMQGAEKQKKKDEEELKKWKDEWQEQVQKATDEGYARTLQTIQLTKAKKIMNIAIEGIKHWGIVGGTERPFEKQAELEFNLFLEKAEQFLKDSEKEC